MNQYIEDEAFHHFGTMPWRSFCRYLFLLFFLLKFWIRCTFLNSNFFHFFSPTIRRSVSKILHFLLLSWKFWKCLFSTCFNRNHYTQHAEAVEAARRGKSSRLENFGTETQNIVPAEDICGLCERWIKSSIFFSFFQKKINRWKLKVLRKYCPLAIQ